jgi:hypothetical protein
MATNRFNANNQFNINESRMGSNTTQNRRKTDGSESLRQLPPDVENLRLEYLNNHLTKIYTEEEENFLRGYCKIFIRFSEQSVSTAQTHRMVKYYYTEMLSPDKARKMIELHNRVMEKYHTPRLARYFV